MSTRTKIICTMGPAVNSLEKILELIDAGMNGARLNFSHGTREEHILTIHRLKEARKQRGVPLAIIIDTKGPEIRIGEVKGEGISVSRGARITLVKEVLLCTGDKLSLKPAHVLDVLEVGKTVLIDDGYLTAVVVERSDAGVVIEFQNPGLLKSEKGINIPDQLIDLPPMTEKDSADLQFGCDQDVDVIAASFIRSSEHVMLIKKFLMERGKSDIWVIAKIEDSQGIANLDSIIQVADGLMVARGDLGVELPLEKIPHLQKMMIKKCYHASKPVVTATQMLESMIKVPRPTRAEVSDVANAIYDSTSVVMLSGETAVGHYPVETVKTMKRIAEEAEEHFPYREFFFNEISKDHTDIPSSVAAASVQTAYATCASALFVYTNSGKTAMALARCRPEMPIFALTTKEKIYHQLALLWGVVPVPSQSAKDVKEAFKIVSSFAMQNKKVQYGDRVVVTAGSPFGISGTTNIMMVENIGEVLVRGFGSGGKRVSGKVTLVYTLETQKIEETKGKFIVLSHCDPSYAPLVKIAKGVVLQNHSEDVSSEAHATWLSKEFNIPLIVQAKNAFLVLKEEEIVTLDPERGIVFRGELPSSKE